MKRWNSYFKKAVAVSAVAVMIAAVSLGTKITVFAATAATDSVMIRNDASTDAGIIGSLNEGDEVEILDVVQSGDGYLWYYIELDNGNTGYCRSDLISASDEELSAFNVEKEPEEEPEEEPAAETEAEQKPEQKPEQKDEGGKDAQGTPASDSEISADNSTVQAAQTESEGYDASRDPNANFAVRFETDADGSGSWYVYNEDNGSRVRISDMQDQENAASASAARGSGIWKTLAIIFGILTVALAAFCIFLIRSIRNSRPVRERKRVVEAAIEDEEDDDTDEEEFFFTDDADADAEDDRDPDDEPDDDDDGEDSENGGDEEEPADDEEGADAPAQAAKEEKSVRNTDSTITKEITEEAGITEFTAEEAAAALAAETALLEKEEQEAGEDADEEAESFAEKAEPAAAAAEVSGNPSFESAEEPMKEEGGSVNEDEEYEEEDYEDEDEEEEEEEPYEESDEDYEEEDYEDEDSFDDSDEYDDEDGTERSARKSRGSGQKGGFLGFIKKVFGSDSREDEDDGDDFDDYDDEPVRREFDEFKDYPEDIDLLPKENGADAEFEEEGQLADDDVEPDYDGRGRLTMQKVMKNVKYNDTDAAFDDGGDMDELSDSLFNDDDDMEYSFISSTRRK